MGMNDMTRIKNPLRKRVLRELKKDAAKYAAIFIMMVLLVSMCSGMRVSNESLKKAYYDSYELYTLEDGHMTFDKALPDSVRTSIEEKGGLRFCDNMFIDEDITGTDKTIRFFRTSDEINNSCLLSGELPAADNEIAIDRVFAKNNNMFVGDNISVGGIDFSITGIIALPQYSTLYESNTDSMFDSINFSIAEVTDGGFAKLDSRKLNYNYAWLYNTACADKIEEAERSDKLMDILEDVLTEYDEAIVTEQVDAITDRLERAGEEYGNILADSFEAKINEITEAAEMGGEEYAELYEKAAAEVIKDATDRIQQGAAEYGAVFAQTGAAPKKTDLSVYVDDFEFGIIENTAAAMLTGAAPEMPSEEEMAAHYKERIKKPTHEELTVNVDDFVFSMIEDAAEAAMNGEEYAGPSEEDFKDRYLNDVPRPSKDQLSEELDDFLFGIIADAAEAELNGEDYDMPEDEEFEDEIDKTDIVGVDNYIPRYVNNAVNFSIEDIGGDEAGVMVMCYMMIALIAFIFAVTISNTIVSEAGVIGTLRASGYTKGELIRHYMVLPIIVTLLSAAVGNIIGYTVMKDFAQNLYLGSYSLTAVKTVFVPSAFVFSTVVPIILMLLINYITLSAKLKLSPLKFLRRDLKKNGNKKAMRLNTKIPFKSRFSLRIFFTNLSGYIVMIVGIMFGAVLIAFGDMFPRLLDDMKEIIVSDMICEYQYVLYDCENADEVTDDQAEKFAMNSFDFNKENFLTDEIGVYGIEKNSRYVPADIPENTVLISVGISEKYGINVGDTIILDEKYKRNSSYSLTVGGIYDYQASLAVFMDIDHFNKVFGNKEGYFTGYFSDKELTELDPDDVAVTMTQSDYTKLSDQLQVSMGRMMDLFKYFGALFFIIVVYVLCRQIIERNFQSIALTKILGFRNSEIGGLYIVSTTIAVIVGLGISIPLIDVAMKAIFKGYLYTMMAGYLPCIISPITYVIMVGVGLGCYAVVAILQMIKVSKISKAEALKNVE